MKHPYATGEPGWELHKDGVSWTRPLLGPEQLLDQVARLTDGHDEVALGFTFTSPLPPALIKSRALEALGRLRFSSPLLASKILPGIHTPEFRSWVYTPVKSVAEVRSWASQTLRVSDLPSNPGVSGPVGEVSGEEFVKRIVRVRLPYQDVDGEENLVTDQHFFVHLLLGSSPSNNHDSSLPGPTLHGLFIHSTHALMDSQVGIDLIRLLLEGISGGEQFNSIPISELPWGEETKNLDVGPTAAVGGVKEGWEVEGVKLMETQARALGNQQPSHSLKPQRTEITEPGKPVRAHRILDEELSSRLIQATKKAGFTITQLWDAVQIIATFEYNPERLGDPQKQHITLFPVIVALRHMIQPPERRRTAVGLLDVGFHLTVPLSLLDQHTGTDISTSRDKLLAVMQSIKSQYVSFLSNPHLPVLETAEVALYPLKELTPPVNPYWGEITNFGVIERILPVVWDGKGVVEGEKLGEGRMIERAVKVEELFLGLRQMTMRTMTHVWTIHSKIHLQVQAADIWDQEYLEGFLDKMITVACALIA